MSRLPTNMRRTLPSLHAFIVNLELTALAVLNGCSIIHVAYFCRTEPRQRWFAVNDPNYHRTIRSSQTLYIYTELRKAVYTESRGRVKSRQDYFRTLLEGRTDPLLTFGMQALSGCRRANDTFLLCVSYSLRTSPTYPYS